MQIEMQELEELKGLQGLRALKLASAFGHHWTIGVSEEEAQEGITVNEIRERALKIPMGPAPGILYPDTKTYGNCVHHVTGTDRLEWLIIPDGTAEFTVNRPSGPVLEAWVDENGEFDISEVDVWHTRKRHVDILVEAVAAVAPDVDVVAALKAYLLKMGEDEDFVAPMFDEAAEFAADVKEALEKAFRYTAFSDRLGRRKITCQLSYNGWDWGVDGLTLTPKDY